MNTSFKTSQRIVHVAAGSSVEAGHPFRAIVRGTKAGKRVREVRTIYAPTLSAAAAYVASNGDKLVSDVRVKRTMDFINVFPPTPAYLRDVTKEELITITK